MPLAGGAAATPTRPADRAPARQRQGRCPRCGPSCAASRTCATSATCCRRLGPVVRRHRPGLLDRPPRGVGRRVRADGPGVRPLRDPRPRGRAPAAVLASAGSTTASAAGCSPTPAFVPFDVYRRSHFAHHKDEIGPDEPDIGLYAGYPITRDSLRRKLRRDAFGNSGWKNLKGLLLAVRSTGGPAGRAAHPRRAGGAAGRSSPPSVDPSSTSCSGWPRG